MTNLSRARGNEGARGTGGTGGAHPLKNLEEHDLV